MKTNYKHNTDISSILSGCGEQLCVGAAVSGATLPLNEYQLHIHSGFGLHQLLREIYLKLLNASLGSLIDIQFNSLLGR